MKRLLGLLAVAGALCAAAPAPSLLDILDAERARSLEGLATRLDDAPLVAARAALAIGRSKKATGAVPLRAHLGAANPAVRALVVYALGLLADASSRPALERLLRSDPNSAVRYSAADAVGRIAAAAPSASPGSPAALEAAARTDRDRDVRGHAAANLDVFRAGPQKQQVAFALQHDFERESDRVVRWHIMWTLSRGYATLTARPFFVRALVDPDDLVRLEAVRGIGRQGDARAVAVIRPLLSDPSWRVQEEAGEALRRLEGKPLSDHLIQRMDGLHLPQLEESPAAIAAPVARPSAPAKPVAPVVAEVPPAPPLYPTSAALMNGPMPGPHPRVRIATSQGTVVLVLYPEWAPLTVANFLKLTNAGYFDGNRWFRIVPDFVVQTGDKTNTGDGDAGYSIGAEENPLEQRAGIVSMGLNYDDKGPQRDSAGTQFYMTLSPQLHLDRDFTVFGEVESGFNVLAHLVEADTMLRVEQIGDGPAPQGS